mmetsp:Transcript_19575/g.29208  ORF Transcript_19575/g.29208 Transcript_19575/m.29208 type:complete len:226 (-) Transcript_19575:227-904(-)
MDEEDEYVLKILVVGDVAVGKTSIIHRYTAGVFSEDHRTTVGVEFSLKELEIDDRIVNVQLWDIAGQDRFIGLLRNFYQNASAALVVFDVTRQQTLQNVVKWKADIDKKILLADGSRIPAILVGNKFDLRNDEGSDTSSFVEMKDAKEVAKKCGFLGFVETSAKDNFNVDKACLALVRKALEAHVRQNEAKAKSGTEKTFVEKKQRISRPVKLTEERRKPAGCCK